MSDNKLDTESSTHTSLKKSNSNNNPNSLNASLDTLAWGISVQNAGGTSLIHITNLSSEQSIKKRRTRADKPNCRKKSKVASKLKADKKRLPYLKNPYFNFLRVFRIRYCDEPQGRSMNQKAAFFWSKLSIKQRALFKPENLSKGVPALSILKHLETWTLQQENNINENADLGCCKKQKPCSRKKKRPCPSPKKKCPRRPKRRSCKPKKRQCRPKKRISRKPKCRPKSRC